MMEWWATREPRERVLMLIGGVFAALVVFVQFIAIPIVRGNADAERAQLTAARSLDALSADLARLSAASGEVGGQAGSLQTDELRAVVVDLAARRGLSVSSVQSLSNGGVAVILDGVDPQLLFTWLADLSSGFGATPGRASLTADGNGGVRASIEFSGGGL